MDSLSTFQNAKDEYWYFHSEISKDTCKKIINLAGDWTSAKVDNEFKEGVVNPEKRISDIFWCNETWLYEIVWKYLHIANKNSNWNFQIDSSEPMQIARYNKKGHFIFHKDGNGYTRHENNNEYTHGKTRKLSMSIILNDDYEGGEFEFYSPNEGALETKQGDIIVFPSYFLHRVKPVTKGTRYSLVTWFCGEPFK